MLNYLQFVFGRVEAGQGLFALTAGGAVSAVLVAAFIAGIGMLEGNSVGLSFQRNLPFCHIAVR